ncbi:hypothetical protein C5167_015463 [Papaver somniferum]|uniref:Transmembrane protein n=1 Tax=Papaver somniferum TaxID=3469 RepID=A0A4Y7J711_PAPSO|nr:uncharacterized protein LOC113358542 [Papaver somniferum]XP_026457920.1 uncharacterized protein LOC113358542 [Papaver somniferum]XP_026457921.1 uncharacterized protein LOC113358542 [Papaver somniferum]XP_026457922.1 uncharacterized protein LOC113358542 [Papaver somniferum]RZC56607.1 hypothetical protein C5167_015463 [Papaver somniferum]
METVCLTTCSLITPTRNHNTRNLNLCSARVIRCCSTKTRSRTGKGCWDSNAEANWTDRFKINFGDELNDDSEFEDDEYVGFGRREKQRRNWWSDEDDNSPEMGRGGGGGGVWEEAVDNIWIIKVFSAFGWLLPAVVASLLLASGPKAFLMPLALPLGQSILSYAIDKLFGRINKNRKPRSGTKTKPFARGSRDTMMSEEEDETEMSQTSGGRSGYQSWVGADKNGPVKQKDNQRETTFGGWDELDLGRKSGDGATKRSPKKRGGLSREMKGKLTKKGRNKSTPLLIRLVIAVFPFLGSWILEK